MKTYAKELLAELAKHGIVGQVRLQRRGHPRLYFGIDGKERFYVIGGTVSDSAHGAKNALADLRRMIGAKNTKAKSSRPKRAKTKIGGAAKAPMLTIKADPFAALAASPLATEMIRARAAQAWGQMWQSTCYRLYGFPSIAGAFAAHEF